jgi:hypothetical protein
LVATDIRALLPDGSQTSDKLGPVQMMASGPKLRRSDPPPAGFDFDAATQQRWAASCRAMRGAAQHDLADVNSRVDQLVSTQPVFEREALVHMRLDPPRRQALRCAVVTHEDLRHTARISAMIDHIVQTFQTMPAACAAGLEPVGSVTSTVRRQPRAY